MSVIILLIIYFVSVIIIMVHFVAHDWSIDRSLNEMGASVPVCGGPIGDSVRTSCSMWWTDGS